MGKDPAFLFYPGDWLGGTIGMSFEEKGAYMELLIYQFNRGPFSEKTAINLLGKIELWNILKIKYEQENGLFWNKKLKYEQERRKAYTESRRKSRLKSDEDTVRIYIVRDNVRKTYKIGSSVNPLRRYNELNNQQNPAIMSDKDPNERDLTLLWYSDFVLRSEEKVLHDKFKQKNIVGEWFLLSNADIQFITDSYEGTYVNRTENENENRS